MKTNNRTEAQKIRDRRVVNQRQFFYPNMSEEDIAEMDRKYKNTQPGCCLLIVIAIIILLIIGLTLN